MRTRVCATAALLLISTWTWAGASTTYDDITVSVELPAYASNHGYADHRVSVANHSSSRSHEVTLFAPFHSYGSGDHISQVRRTIVVGPSSSVKVSLFQPPLPMNGTGMGVIIDGKVQKNPTELDTSSHCRYGYRYYGGHGGTVCLLLSRGVNSDDFRDHAHKAIVGVGSPSSTRGGYGSEPLNLAKMEATVDSWSTQWLSYSRFDGVVVTASEAERMPAEVKSALRRYIRCGGSLLVLGAWQPPDAWRAEHSEAGPLRIGHMQFGVCLSRAEDFREWPDEIWKLLQEKVWGPSARFLTATASVANANAQFAVVEDLGIPVRGLFLLVLGFVIVMGPVNLYILSRKNRRIWMLWTVPALALIGSLAVVVYAAIAEGWHGRVRFQTITLLDDESHEATTIGTTAYYCPLTPRGGLRYDNDTEVSPMAVEDYRGGRGRTVDWTRDQHLASGWIAARVPAHFRLRKSESRRERIRVSKRDDGGTVAVNGLGADIVELWYADEDGRIYSAKGVRAGDQVELVELTPLGGRTARAGADQWRQMFLTSWIVSGQQIRKDPASCLQKGSYICLLDDTVFVEQTLEYVNHEQFESIVFGRVKGGADAGQDPESEEVL